MGSPASVAHCIVRYGITPISNIVICFLSARRSAFWEGVAGDKPRLPTTGPHPRTKRQTKPAPPIHTPAKGPFGQGPIKTGISRRSPPANARRKLVSSYTRPCCQSSPRKPHRPKQARLGWGCGLCRHARPCLLPGRRSHSWDLHANAFGMMVNSCCLGHAAAIGSAGVQQFIRIGRYFLQYEL